MIGDKDGDGVVGGSYGVGVVNPYCQLEKSKKWLGDLESAHLVASVSVSQGSKPQWVSPSRHYWELVHSGRKWGVRSIHTSEDVLPSPFPVSAFLCFPAFTLAAALLCSAMTSTPGGTEPHNTAH